MRTNIAIQKSRYEENLDAMWRNYNKCGALQVPEYQKQVDKIKACGCKVLRNSVGKHKIVIK